MNVGENISFWILFGSWVVLFCAIIYQSKTINELKSLIELNKDQSVIFPDRKQKRIMDLQKERDSLTEKLKKYEEKEKEENHQKMREKYKFYQPYLPKEGSLVKWGKNVEIVKKYYNPFTYYLRWDPYKMENVYEKHAVLEFISGTRSPITSLSLDFWKNFKKSNYGMKK